MREFLSRGVELDGVEVTMMTGTIRSVLLVLGCCATACGSGGTPLEAGSAGGGSGGNAGGGPVSGGTATGGAGAAGTAMGGAAPGGAATAGAGTGGMATGGVATGGTPAGGAGTSGTGATGAAGAGTSGAPAGGAGAGGGADCFPPITDFAARDGGFGAAEREIVELGSGDSVSLFRPSDANFGEGGCRHPLLVWGNGSTNTVDIWASHLSRAASFGFIVVAPEQTQVDAVMVS